MESSQLDNNTNISNNAEQYKKEIEEAANWWNTNEQINQEVKLLDERHKFTERKNQAKEQFAKAFNKAITILFEQNKVDTINQAIMIIGSDLQDRCINFPKSPRGLAAHIEEENVRRLLQNRIRCCIFV
jgi:GTP-binding protein EngB required for normal cell division